MKMHMQNLKFEYGERVIGLWDFCDIQISITTAINDHVPKVISQDEVGELAKCL